MRISGMQHCAVMPPGDVWDALVASVAGERIASSQCVAYAPGANISLTNRILGDNKALAPCKHRAATLETIAPSRIDSQQVNVFGRNNR